MALTVEDGTGLANADAFWDEASVSAYLASTGYAPLWPALSTPRKEELIRAATRSLCVSFTYRGSIYKETQALAFPRIDLEDREGREITGVPLLVKYSTAELAYFISQNNILEDSALTTLDSVKVGPISLDLSSSAKVTKYVPDSVIRMMSEYGGYRFGRLRQRKLIAG